MSYISRVGNLAAAPELRESDTGVFCYARIIVNDRERDDQGDWGDGPATTYNVAVSGDQARNLCETAQESGNIALAFGGRYRVRERNRDGKTYLQHEVRADYIGVSLRHQIATVRKP